MSERERTSPQPGCQIRNPSPAMPKTRNKPLRYTKEIIEQRRAERKAKRKEEFAAIQQASLVSNTSLTPLYQKKPRTISTYTLHKNRSFTDSLESYQNGADKERQILQRNKRKPTKEIKLNLLLEFSAIGIKVLRKWIFYHLAKDGIEAVANIELTRTKPRIGKPNNRVHFHILTDDKRDKDELRALFITACERCGLMREKDFEITIKDDINNADRYFEYFTKYDSDSKKEFEAIRKEMYQAKDTQKNEERDWNDSKDVGTEKVTGKKWDWKTVLLFRPYTGLDKFKEIGKWFEKPKKDIWKEIRAFMRAMEEAEKAREEGRNKQVDTDE